LNDALGDVVRMASYRASGKPPKLPVDVEEQILTFEVVFER